MEGINFDLSRKTSSDDVNVHFDESLYTIHRYVYEGDNKSLSTLLFRRDKSTDVSRQDMHGKFLCSVKLVTLNIACN